MSPILATSPAPLVESAPLTEPVDDLDTAVRVILSAALDCPVFEPQAITLASLDGCSSAITLHRFFDGEPVEVFELSGIEVERLIHAYRLHLRRQRRQRQCDGVHG